MKKTILIIMVIGMIVSCGACFSKNLQPDQNNKIIIHFPSVESNSIIQQKSSKTVNVVTSIEGCPKTAHKGHNITVTCVVTNKGTKPITNVVIDSQGIHRNLGTLKSGQIKKITYTDYIYTDKDVEEMYGPGSTVSNPYPVGGWNLYFKDYKGVKHHTEFKTHWIKLV